MSNLSLSFKETEPEADLNDISREGTAIYLDEGFLEEWKKRLADSLEICTQVISLPNLTPVGTYAALLEFQMVKDSLLKALPKGNANVVKLALENAEYWKSLQDRLDSTPQSVKSELDQELTDMHFSTVSTPSSGSEMKSAGSATSLDAANKECGSGGAPFGGVFVRKYLVLPMAPDPETGKLEPRKFLHSGMTSITISSHPCSNPATCRRMTLALDSRSKDIRGRTAFNLKAKGEPVPPLTIKWSTPTVVSSTEEGRQRVLDFVKRSKGVVTPASSV